MIKIYGPKQNNRVIQSNNVAAGANFASQKPKITFNNDDGYTRIPNDSKIAPEKKPSYITKNWKTLTLQVSTLSIMGGILAASGFAPGVILGGIVAGLGVLFVGKF